MSQRDGRKKIIIIIIFFILGTVTIVYGKHQLLTWASIYRTSLENAIDLDTQPLYEIPSPDEKLTLEVYYRGGPFLFSDYSYVGVIHSSKSDERKVLFWVDQHYEDIKWNSNETVTFVNKLKDDKTAQINIHDETYDFRKKR
ncbi:DUF5412 family protein [Alkaliphilus transvaalensis]|uniref:DUF5412 family protein n=1 Tax=Alkaliphilus transvaalensis TaxID=114628 RepID=UPI00047E0DA5|nr:DUF5412 family protein [Alkaliphilus transvaalensis]